MTYVLSTDHALMQTNEDQLAEPTESTFNFYWNLILIYIIILDLDLKGSVKKMEGEAITSIKNGDSVDELCPFLKIIIYLFLFYLFFLGGGV